MCLQIHNFRTTEISRKQFTSYRNEIESNNASEPDRSFDDTTWEMPSCVHLERLEWVWISKLILEWSKMIVPRMNSIYIWRLGSTDIHQLQTITEEAETHNLVP
jgi:hypothetical protein